MRKAARNILAVASSVVPAAAQAHPGPHRDELAWSLVHAVTQADHLVAMATVGLGAAIFACVVFLLATRNSGAPER